MDYDRNQLVSDTFGHALQELEGKPNPSRADMEAAVQAAMDAELAFTMRSIRETLERNRAGLLRAVQARMDRPNELVRLDIER